IIFATLLSHLLPAGEYQRALIDGRQRVVPGSYAPIDQTPIGMMGMFNALAGGFSAASNIIFVVFAGGIMFGILEKSKMIEHAVGTFIKELGLERRFVIVVIMTYVFGLLGIFVGYENNIAMVPIAAVLATALGGDLILAAGIAVGGITVGFGLSPVNPYTVGIGHQIAEMPLFSGAVLRSILCFVGLSLLAYYNVRYFKKILINQGPSLGHGLDTSGLALSKDIADYQMSANHWLVFTIFIGGLGFMLFGIFQYRWYLTEISSIFIIIGIIAGIASGMSSRTISETTLQSIAVVAPGAFMVGYATTIRVLLESGHVSDTIAYELSNWLTTLPLYASAFLMSIAQSIMNLFIPSGSGQALATLPIMIPVGDLVGLTRQSTILAFQIGDGVTNIINPTLGGLIAMLSMCRVPFDRWLRYIFPLALLILIVAWGFLIFSVAIEWGPA
ncbi:MAG: AbgT family transporter, partial [Bacteroidota bacterium]